MQPDLFAELESGSETTRKHGLSSGLPESFPGGADPAVILAVLRRSSLQPDPDVVAMYEALAAGGAA